jgi:hypothetical protein
MPENAIIPSQTTINITGSVINILTQYIGNNDSGVVNAFIIEVIGGQTVEGVFFKMGEGGISMVGSSPIFSMNSNGELIVSSADAANFNVDTSTGQLQYIT